VTKTDDALVMLDVWATLTTERTTFTSDEILDFILDVRSTLTALDAVPEISKQ
jgi:hypothetical protein